MIMNSYNSCLKTNTMEKNDQSAKTILWIARITGTALVIITLVFGIGSLLEGINKKEAASTFPPSLLLTFFIWGIGLVGLVWALWNEKKGGILSFVSFVVFILMAATGSGSIAAAGVLAIFLIPPILYLTYWYMTRDTNSKLPK